MIVFLAKTVRHLLKCIAFMEIYFLVMKGKRCNAKVETEIYLSCTLYVFHLFVVGFKIKKEIKK